MLLITLNKEKGTLIGNINNSYIHLSAWVSSIYYKIIQNKEAKKTWFALEKCSLRQNLEEIHQIAIIYVYLYSLKYLFKEFVFSP